MESYNPENQFLLRNLEFVVGWGLLAPDFRKVADMFVFPVIELV